VVGDNPARLESVVRQARGRSDLLVFSGGLGPTEDDLTKQTVARAFGDTLRFDEAELEKIRAFFTAWGRTMPENNKKQAMVPTHGRKIPNANGTAPGMIFEDQAAPGKYAVLLPGPPKELQPMFLNSVKPWLAAMSDSVLHSVTLRVTGVGESHLESRIGHLLENANPTRVLCQDGGGRNRITARPRGGRGPGIVFGLCEAFLRYLGDCVYAMGADSWRKWCEELPHGA
jgi:nicotinamide-nucleotide amidase